MLDEGFLGSKVMSRILVRIATLAFGAALITGCSSVGTSATAQSASPATQAPATDAQSLSANIGSNVALAQSLRAVGKLDDATHTLAQLMLVAPDDPRVVGEYGKVLAERGNSQDAIAFLKRAIELQPNDWTIYSALGVAYDQIDDRNNAKIAYEHALMLKPGEPVVLNNMAVSRMLAGDYAGAKLMLTQAAAAGSNYPKISNNLQMVASYEAAHSVSKPVIAATAPVQQKSAPVSVAKLAPLPAKSATPATRVVMEKVPADPLAGPVAAATHAPRKLMAEAATAKPPVKAKVQAKPQAKAQAPSLRTAAD